MGYGLIYLTLTLSPLPAPNPASPGALLCRTRQPPSPSDIRRTVSDPTVCRTPPMAATQMARPRSMAATRWPRLGMARPDGPAPMAAGRWPRLVMARPDGPAHMAANRWPRHGAAGSGHADPAKLAVPTKVHAKRARSICKNHTAGQGDPNHCMCMSYRLKMGAECVFVGMAWRRLLMAP